MPHQYVVLLDKVKLTNITNTHFDKSSIPILRNTLISWAASVPERL